MSQRDFIAIISFNADSSDSANEYFANITDRFFASEFSTEGVQEDGILLVPDRVPTADEIKADEDFLYYGED